MFSRERVARKALSRLDLQPITRLDAYPRARAHYEALCRHAAFAPDMADYLAKLGAEIARLS